MCYEDENNCESTGTKNNAISLSELLKINFDVKATIKDEIHKLMSTSQYIWKTRPIPYKLNYYAGSDVYYLPKLYDLFCQKIDAKIVRNISLQDIFKECQKYLNYLTINTDIKNYTKMNLTEGTKINGLIKNFQNYCVYIQLNIGYIGIVDVFPSVQILKDNYKLGDIVDFTIIKIDNKKKRMMLDLSDNNSNKKEINIKPKEKQNGENSSLNLIHGLNINKESFFPKSYNRDKNASNNNNNEFGSNYNASNQYQYNNYNYMNNNINNGYYMNNPDNYIKENDGKYYFHNDNKNSSINNENIFNNNYNGLFYDYEGNYYYYNNNEDANNEENDDENSNSFYYTLKPFPK